jgi:hypothetical protein
VSPAGARRGAWRWLPLALLAAAAPCAGCASRWTASFAVPGAGAPELEYAAVGVVPMTFVAGAGADRGQAELASELLLRAVRRAAPFRVWDRLLPESAALATAPFEADGQPIDGLIVGRMRFWRRDRSGWERPRPGGTSTQGNPVFVRRTAFRLDLLVELRSLATGRVELQRGFSDELVSESDGPAFEREAFERLLARHLLQLVELLAPAPLIERRVLLPWHAAADAGR